MIKNLIKKVFHSYGYALKPIHKKPFFSFNDKLVKIKIGKFNLIANQNHTIEFNIKNFPFYNLNLPRLIEHLNNNNKKGKIVDIGANIGDTAAFIRNIVNLPIICIEGNDYYYDLLKKNTAQFKDIHYFKKYLSEKSESIMANISFSIGTSSLENGNAETELISLDDLASQNLELFRDVSLIKIDTDGFDTKILKGAIDFIKKTKPVLFFEYDREFLDKQNESGIDVIESLFSIGYKKILFYDNYGRFILSLSSENITSIRQLHNYIKGYKAPFEFYDICLFHESDDELAESFILKENSIY